MNSISPSTTATRIKAQKPKFGDLSENDYVRESQILQSKKFPENGAPLPFSAPTLWRKVRAGVFPKPHKIGPQMTVWKVSQIREWMQAQEDTPYTPMSKLKKNDLTDG